MPNRCLTRNTIYRAAPRDKSRRYLSKIPESCIVGAIFNDC
ncbi:hypothetical protein L579_0374 [Pantoea sp. AS-PWVM4]|nr:hypothetical protein L579_0374 [Pantoea sp. AS-PWVM4]